jgi:GTP cyclohydrolase II
MTSDQNILAEILKSVKSLHQDHLNLVDKVNSSNNKIGKALADIESRISAQEEISLKKSASSVSIPSTVSSSPLLATAQIVKKPTAGKWPSRITLTTYPGQSGVDPAPLNWGKLDPLERGPVVVNRSASTIKHRNAIGAHSGSYSIYQALAVALNDLPVDHKPDFTNTEPPVKIGPFPQWGDSKKIVSMDPYGHIAPWVFKDYIERGIDVRPTIAITKAHMQLTEIRDLVREGKIKVDGKVVLNEEGDLAVSKVAVEPVWYLPGIAERMNIDEGTLRRTLFEVTGGSYPELITRSDIKVFLPPIGGLTAYIFGDPAKVSDKNARLALRVHDECNGSDVFGSDICTCRPYLIFGIAEAVKEAQNGGSGVVIYFRKEGRALGEVTKYLVYNARKRGGDTAAEYFKRTENIAGVKDMRFQFLMPDILHFLGITKIDRMLSMSNMKHDAIVEQGIPIYERVPIPDELIPPDSRVEIDAKIHAGYFTDGKVMTAEELKNVKGRDWDDCILCV